MTGIIVLHPRLRDTNLQFACGHLADAQQSGHLISRPVLNPGVAITHSAAFATEYKSLIQTIQAAKLHIVILSWEFQRKC